MPELKKIKGVEIFSAGKWNSDNFTEQDLDAMVIAFNKTKDHIPPYLKLGHDPEQSLLKADGLPAAGWVEKLYRNGDKLLADFRDIPDKIYKLIEKGAYRKVSIELYQGLEILEQKFTHYVAAVAILGAETPGVMNLNDILARYGLKDYDKKIKAFTDVAESIKIYDYINKDKGGSMPELDKDLIDAKAQIKNLEAKLEASTKEATQFKADADKSVTELEQAKTDLDTSRKDFSDAALKLKDAEIGKQVAELQGAKLCSPAMKPFVSQLLDADKKEFSITKEDKEKEYSRFDLIKETLELAKASDVNFDNNSVDSEGEPNKFSVEKVEAEIATYIEANKVTYTTAYKAVIKKHESAKKTDVVEGDE